MVGVYFLHEFARLVFAVGPPLQILGRGPLPSHLAAHGLVTGQDVVGLVVALVVLRAAVEVCGYRQYGVLCANKVDYIAVLAHKHLES